jgi:hypothetical protein
MISQTRKPLPIMLATRKGVYRSIHTRKAFRVHDHIETEGWNGSALGPQAL